MGAPPRRRRIGHDRAVRLAILYFSATGNTDHVARYLARKLDGRPFEAVIRSVESQPPEELLDFEVLAVGFPVFGLDSPAFMHGYLERLPPGDGRAGATVPVS